MRTTIRIQVVLLVWLSNQNIDWWHWLVACCPHTVAPHDTTNDASFTTCLQSRAPEVNPASLAESIVIQHNGCLLYTSDAADE